jgi:hypothetical protein
MCAVSEIPSAARAAFWRGIEIHFFFDATYATAPSLRIPPTFAVRQPDSKTNDFFFFFQNA